jgi:phosphoserine phosphatase RsbX
METVNSLSQYIEYGVATLVLPGQRESGDRHLVAFGRDRILLAAIDGIGHGEEAANAAKAAVAALESCADEPISALVRGCHERLRSTRGVVLSLASIDAVRGTLSWLGVGNVQGLLFRASARLGSQHEALLLRGGVVGSRLPSLHEAQLPVRRGDTLVFFTDGVQPSLIGTRPLTEKPQRAADAILQQQPHANDDALILIARVTGIPS